MKTPEEIAAEIRRFHQSITLSGELAIAAAERERDDLKQKLIAAEHPYEELTLALRERDDARKLLERVLSQGLAQHISSEGIRIIDPLREEIEAFLKGE